jgi:hypothetical protein
MAFRVFSDACHCLSFALATNKTTVFPFAVAFARLGEPVKAKGVSSTYLQYWKPKLGNLDYYYTFLEKRRKKRVKAGNFLWL